MVNDLKNHIKNAIIFYYSCKLINLIFIDEDTQQQYQMEANSYEKKQQLKSEKVLHRLVLSIPSSKSKTFIISFKIKIEDEPDQSAKEIGKVQFTKKGEKYSTSGSFQYIFLYEKAYELIATVLRVNGAVIASARENYRYIIREQKLDLELKTPQNALIGVLTMHSESIEDCSFNVKMIMDYDEVNLGGCTCFAKKCYVKIHRKSDKVEIFSIYNQTKSKSVQIKLENLKSASEQQYIVFLLTKSNEIIGECILESKDLSHNSSLNRIMKINLKQIGMISFRSIQVSRPLNIDESYMKFHQSGLIIQSMFFIDYTASNESQKAENNLHGKGMVESKYKKALLPVGEIVLQKDSIGKSLLYGFGAKVYFPTLSSGDSELTYFALNGNQRDPYVVGKQGLLQTYERARQYITGGSQTLFAPILKCIKQKAITQKERKRSYIIATIFTDGMIDDLRETKDLLVEMGRLPVSIIIIGIGKGERTSKGSWTAMKTLDDNQMQMVDSKGRKTERDLVKFVAFNEWEGKDKHQFAREVLSEYTTQFLEYHKLENIKYTDYPCKMISSCVSSIKLQFRKTFNSSQNLYLKEGDQIDNF